MYWEPPNLREVLTYTDVHLFLHQAGRRVMSIRIDRKIVGYEVVRKEEEAAARAEAQLAREERQSAKIIRMT